MKIKFRAWDKTFKDMVYDVQNVSRKRIIGESACESFQEVIDSWEYEVMQFTGLHDKNGKEIYEGDIVEFKDYSNGAYIFGKQPKSKGEVYWDKRKSGWKAKGHGVSWFEGDKYEVIGNKYENPELLEES